MFVTPYLTEINRIQNACPELHFLQPHSEGEGGKLANLKQILETGWNVATTHSLMRKFDDETAELIRKGGYTLVLDEVFNVITFVDMDEDDMKLGLTAGVFTNEEDMVDLKDEDYNGSFFKEMTVSAKVGTLRLHDQRFFFILTSKEIFESFQEIIILTYLFDAQIQKYYFDMLGAEYHYIGTCRKDDHYEFTDSPTLPAYAAELKNKIHILDHAKLNGIGMKKNALSASWYRRAKKNRNGQLKRIKANLYNYFRHICNAPANKILWTSYEDYQHSLSGKGYTKSFIPCNMRATNDYADRIYLAYCVNRYFNPMLKQYFLCKGIEVKEDRYALSEMVQWIWRSAVRRGEEVWIYIPSVRMRTLLEDWLDGLSGEGDERSTEEAPVSRSGKRKKPIRLDEKTAVINLRT